MSLTELMADQNLVSVASLVAELQPALERNDRARVNQIIGQLIALHAPMGGQWQQLAYIAAGNGELSLARQAMDELVAGLGGDAMAKFQKAATLALLGLWREADALLQTLPESVPDPVSNAYCHGTAALNLGRLDDARAHLERVTQLQPRSGLAWFSLALATDLSGEPALADRLIAAERGMQTVSPADRIPYYYALGKTFAEQGEHARAFQAFARGAGELRAAVPYDRNADRASAAAAVEGYSADRIDAIAARREEETARTIFVTGLPRSGTTLVQQILTAHSMVSDGAETSYLHLLAGEIGGPPWPALARYVETRGPGPAVTLWHHWLAELFPGPGRVIDKTVTTSRFMGLVAALLPDAPLIWITRDPLDRAWSCFRTNFSGMAVPWSNDLRDIAVHFQLEDRLLAQWQEILGERLLVVSYEALVTDPASWIPRILAHCGLAPEPQVFAPHENRRPVSTASLAQVRRPIHRDGIGAAEPYRAFLQPFIDAYHG